MMIRLLLVSLSLAALARAAEPVGLLSMVSGEVRILRASESAPVVARTADLIAAGDRVLTGRNSEAAFLFCPESRAAKMAAETEVRFEAATFAVRKGKLAEERKVPTCRLPSNLALTASSKLQSGMTRLRGSDLVLRSPARTNIADLNPRFRWEPVDGATTYELKLLDREERILWRQSLSSTESPYPGDALALVWGQKYWWRVTAREDRETISEVGSYFQVLPSEQAERVRAEETALRQLRAANPADNGPLFLLAFLYEENGMLDAAARLYGELSQRMGPQDWVQARLNDLMSRLGWDRLDSTPTR
ncbi:MAG TPA: hypothetical protein VIC04_00005 [Terriglobia bacterium]|jgi:hypothetical protein